MSDLYGRAENVIGSVSTNVMVKEKVLLRYL